VIASHFVNSQGFLESSEAMMALQRKLRGAEPTVVKRNTQEANETSSTTTEVLPVVMVGVACAVIACAVMLYITDMRDRCHHKRSFHNREKRAETASHEQIHPSMTSASTGSNMSERWVEGGGKRDGALYPLMLPPFPPDADDVEDMGMTIACVPPKQICLTRVSTTNSSLGDGNVWENGIVPYDNSQAAGGGVLEQHAVTELSDTSRVGDRTTLGDLVQRTNKHETKIAVMSSSPIRSESSPCSSLTDISEGTESSPQLVGETVLKDEGATPKKKDTVPRTSLEFSPDTPVDEERDAVVGSHLRHCAAHGADVDVRESPSQQTQLEHLIASIPVTNPTGRRPLSPVHDMAGLCVRNVVTDHGSKLPVRVEGVGVGSAVGDSTEQAEGFERVLGVIAVN
jgi:hypothetical protein